MKRLAMTLKMFIFTINCRADRHVYVTVSNDRVARSENFHPTASKS